MKDVNKKIWAELNKGEQEPFIEKANFLIQKGYIQEKDIYKLTETIYNKQNKINEN